MRRIYVCLGVLSSLVYTGCKNNSQTISPQSQPGTISITINHSVDSKAIVWDSILYKNEAGDMFSITQLQYYLSAFRFYYHNAEVCKTDSVFYIDAHNTSPMVLKFSGITFPQSDSVSFCIGVEPALNITNALPATYENTIMGWPDAMGGGYHFLKLEGHWMDTANSSGFAMHLGKTGYQVMTGVKCDLSTIASNKKSALKMKMNVNEWFRNPNVYSFNVDGVYSMGNPVLMKKLSENGIDVFTVE